MGLVDLTARVATVENDTDYIKRWLRKNEQTISAASDFDARISMLEGGTATQFTDQLKAYSTLFQGKENEHGFIFFTDSHNLANTDLSGAVVTDYDILMSMHFYRTIFQNSPARYVLNGGDWINTKHTLEDAKYFLSRIPNLMREEITERSYGIIGNHDLNGEGNSGLSSRLLSSQQLSRLWFNKNIGYYTVDYGNTRCFMFDSGDQSNTMTTYRWDQLDWFADQLINNTTIPHLFGAIHIIYKNILSAVGQTIKPLGKYIVQIADAYNHKTQITITHPGSNITKTYDFRNRQDSGMFHFMIAGHMHNTQNCKYWGIPVIWSPAGLQADCFYVDFDNAKLKTIRISATTTDMPTREIDIVPNSGPTANWYDDSIEQ